MAERNASRSTTPADGQRILLAEDDYEMRRLLTWTLTAEGYEVTECLDGGQLLEWLAADFAGEEPPFDLIIADNRMPQFTGMQILRAARRAGLPPMILISAFADRHTHVEAARLGVQAFLDKPFELDELVAAVLEILPRRRLIERGSGDES